MNAPTRQPLIGIPACRKQIDPHPFHVAGEKYVMAVLNGAEAMPVLIPPVGTRLDLDEVLSRLDGIMLTGSLSNIEPHHYGGTEHDSVPPHDPERDSTTLPLIRTTVDRGLPLFAICRGSQEMNVAFGGTLLPRVHEVPGKMDHREDESQPLDVRYAPAHEVRLVEGGLLQQLAASDRAMVNSLHAQGVDRLGDGLVTEALAPDGLVEAFRVADTGAFALAVQWHPEWKVREDAFSLSMFRAFGEACREHAAHG